MKRMIHTLAAALLLSLSMIACAEPNEGVPAFKVIAPNGQESILIGSLHIPFEGLRQPAPSVLRGARHLVIEGSSIGEPLLPIFSLEDRIAPKELKSNGRVMGAAWAMPLTDAEVDMLRRNIYCEQPEPVDDVTMNMILSLKSARIAALFASIPCRQPGQLSRDEILGQAASAYSVPTVKLETQVAAEKQRRSVPERIYVKLLYAALSGEIGQKLSQVINALNSGDVEAVTRITNSVYGSPSDAAIFSKLMVQERNLAWMPSLQGYLDQGRAVVVIGAAHLSGTDGVIELLTAAGYTVEPIVLPSA